MRSPVGLLALLTQALTFRPVACGVNINNSPWDSSLQLEYGTSPPVFPSREF